MVWKAMENSIGKMEIIIEEIGKITNSMDMGLCVIKMAEFMKVSFNMTRRTDLGF